MGGFIRPNVVDGLPRDFNLMIASRFEMNGLLYTLWEFNFRGSTGLCVSREDGNNIHRLNWDLDLMVSNENFRENNPNYGEDFIGQEVVLEIHADSSALRLKDL